MHIGTKKTTEKQEKENLEIAPNRESAMNLNRLIPPAGHEKKRQPKHKKKPKTKNQYVEENMAKDILDKWATYVIRETAIYERNEVSGVDQSKGEDYDPKKYKNNICLWIPPKDCIRIEFEDTPERNCRYIREIESAAKSLDLEYCITDHGGKSQYFNMFSIKGLPVNEDNKIAKDLFIDTVTPQSAKSQLDKTNLGWTLSPVIGHAHWKKKYNGAVHKIIRGKDPLEHKNEYPKELLKQIKKSKQQFKKAIIKTRRNNQWVEDFLINYCTEHELPGGQRHFIIEKNLAALIIHRSDRDEILSRYLNMQKRKTNTLRTWFNSILNGQFSEVSPGELVNYIKNNNIPFIIIDEETKEEKSYTVSQKEHAFLADPNLLSIINDEFDKTIVEEKNSRIAIFLNGCGKWVKNANITSYNLCINSNSGAGKDYITKNVLKMFPKADVASRSRISPTTLTYWHNSKFEPDWTWDGKILSLLDISNSILNCEVFKLFCSDESSSTVVIDQKACDIKITGKPVMTITTASASPNNEMLRRFPFLELDETINQTRAIKKAQAKAAASGEIMKYDPLITKALDKLKRVKVKIPFAEELVETFPDGHLIMRTHFSRQLDYIKASAALHQFQRKRDDNDFIIAETQDYDNAIILLKKTTTNPMMIPLSTKQRRLLNQCRELRKFSVKQLEPYVPFYAQSKIYAVVGNLQNLGFLQSYLEDVEGAKKPVRFYEYVEFELDDIPNWEELQNICRKKGIEGNKGIKGIEEIKGINASHMEKRTKNNITSVMLDNSNNNSLNSLNSCPNSPKEKNFFEQNEEILKCKVRDILQSKPKYQWTIDELAFRCNLSGIKAKEHLKNILTNDISQNQEKSHFILHDEKGLYWSYQE